MASPIRVHRPKCDFAGLAFAGTPPTYKTKYDGECTCFEFPNGSTPPLLTGTDLQRGILVVKVEWRQYLNDDKGDWYVFAWTTAPDKNWWGLGNGKPDQKVSWYVANNATQVLKFVRDNPALYPPNGPGTYPSVSDWARFLGAPEPHPIQEFLQRFGSPDDLVGQKINITINTPKEGTMNTDALRRQAAEILLLADQIDSRPDEPEGLRLKKRKREPQVNIIWWRMRFDKANGHRDGSGTRWYTYAAVRTSEGLWNTTGPQSPKAYTWDQLINWIYDNMEEPVIYHVDSLTALP